MEGVMRSPGNPDDLPKQSMWNPDALSSGGCNGFLNTATSKKDYNEIPRGEADEQTNGEVQQTPEKKKGVTPNKITFRPNVTAGIDVRRTVYVLICVFGKYYMLEVKLGTSADMEVRDLRRSLCWEVL
jgi:hypothetical protein